MTCDSQCDHAVGGTDILKSKMASASDSKRLMDWIGMLVIACLQNEVSIRRRRGLRDRDVPSLVGESVIVQPLIGEHAAEYDQPEGGIALHGIRRVGDVAEQGTPEFRLGGVWTEFHRSEGHGQSDDVPQGKDDSGRLKESGKEQRMDHGCDVTGGLRGELCMPEYFAAR